MDVSVERLAVTVLVLLGGIMLLILDASNPTERAAIVGLMGVVVGWWTPGLAIPGRNPPDSDPQAGSKARRIGSH